MGVSWFASHGAGAIMPFVHMELDFRAPLRPDDELLTTVLLDSAGRSSVATRVTGRLADGTVSFEGRFVQVFVDGATMKPMPIPAAYADGSSDEAALAAGMIAGAFLGALGAVRSALGWRTVIDGVTLDPRLDALFACLRVAGPRKTGEPRSDVVRAGTLRMAGLFGARVGGILGTRPARGVRARNLTCPLARRCPRGCTRPIRPRPGCRLLVYFHGGGFVVGDLDTHDALCRTLAAEAGAIVLSVAYRLAPEHPFPAAIDDALRAFDWAAANAAALGGSPGRVGVGGDSAGANLATVVAQARRARAAIADRAMAAVSGGGSGR